MTSYLALRLHKVPCGSQISPIVVAYISHLTQNSPTELFGIHFSQDTPQVTRKAIMMAVDSQRKIGKNSHSKGTLATTWCLAMLSDPDQEVTTTVQASRWTMTAIQQTWLLNSLGGMGRKNYGPSQRNKREHNSIRL